MWRRADRRLAVKSMKLARSEMESKKRATKIGLLEKRVCGPSGACKGARNHSVVACLWCTHIFHPVQCCHINAVVRRRENHTAGLPSLQVESMRAQIQHLKTEHERVAETARRMAAAATLPPTSVGAIENSELVQVGALCSVAA